MLARDRRRVAAARRPAATDLADPGAERATASSRRWTAAASCSTAATTSTWRLALEGDDRIDEAVISLPADGVVRTELRQGHRARLSTPDKEREHGYFPLSLLFCATTCRWLFDLDDTELAKDFHAQVIKPTTTYNIPAIELDKETSKSAVATVFEKVNTGGLALNVFELLTADVRRRQGRTTTSTARTSGSTTTGRRPSSKFADLPGAGGLSRTPTSSRPSRCSRPASATSPTRARRPPAISAKREDVLKLTLDDYLEWVDPLREAFIWASDFLADRHIFDATVPALPEAAGAAGGDQGRDGARRRPARRRASGSSAGSGAGSSASSTAARSRPASSATSSRSRRGRADASSAVTPRTVQDASFVESRLHSLRTRNAAAYKGIYALLLANGARDWMEDKALDKVQYVNLAVDIHHIFPQKWCDENGIDDEHRESIVNKTAICARTNRTIGGVGTVVVPAAIEKKAQIPPASSTSCSRAHLVPAELLRADDFEPSSSRAASALCQLIEQAMGKAVQRDIDRACATEDSAAVRAETEVAEIRTRRRADMAAEQPRPHRPDVRVLAPALG